MPSHRAKGFGRYVARRTSAPRHLAARTTVIRRPTPIYLVAGVLSMISLALIGLRVAQTESAPRASAVPTPRIGHPAPVLSVPSPYRPKRPTPRAERQAAKQRPSVLPATPEADAVTPYCRHETGPYSRAIADGGDWVCRPLFGAPAPVRPGPGVRT